MKSPLPVSLSGRDLLRITDLVPAEAEAILDLADELKLDRTPRLPGRTLGLIFGQPSTRTRISFGVAIVQLGGGFVTLTPQEMQLSRGESLSDTAHVLSRYLDALAIRVLSHDELEQWAAAAQIPVINALTSVEHPCQALADALTIRQRLGGLDGVKIAWVGDGTNVLVSLAQIGQADRDGGRRRLSRGLRPAGRHAAHARPRPARGRRRRRRPRHGHLGLARAGGDEASSGSATSSPTASTRRSSRSRLPEAIVLHCLPAHPGEEITPGALYGDRSAVWDEAENRLHVQKALLALLLS